MKSAKLAHRLGEELGCDVFERPILVAVLSGEGESGVMARRGLIVDGDLSSIQEDVGNFDLFRHDWGMAWLACDNPFVDSLQRQRLDERGVIRTGAVLENGDILASVLETVRRRGRRTEPGKCWAVDCSWNVAPKWRGARVKSVRLLHRSDFSIESPRTVYARIQIAIDVEHELAAGDVVLYRDQPMGTVARFIDDANMPQNGNRPVDLVLPRAMGERLGLRFGECQEVLLGKAFDLGAHVVQARAMEAYSLITCQPLRSSPCPGQLVRENQIEWLQARGLIGNLTELTSLKSDDLSARGELRRLHDSSRLSPTSIPPAGGPESLLQLQTYLRMLGLDPALKPADHSVALSVRAASDEDMLRWSSGQVRKPETVDSRFLEDVKTGLFCPLIFGPTGNSRRLRFGHIVLPCPVVSFLWRTGHPSALEMILNLSGDTIESILRNETWVQCDDSAWQLVSAQESHQTGGEPRTGALAIEAMLRMTPARSELPNRTHHCQFVQRIVPVGPAQIRPLVLLDSGNFATADVNDLYRGLINRANRLSKLEELKVPPVILHNERREVQRCFDQLQANSLLPEPDAAMRDGGEKKARLKDCLAMLARQFSVDGKRVDWSGSARVVSSGTAHERHVRLPQALFETLKLDPDAPVLLAPADGDSFAFVALLSVPHDAAVIELPSKAFSQLELTGPTSSCVVHRPLGSDACAEARRLLDGDIEPVQQFHKTGDWVEAADLNDFAFILAQAAIKGSKTVLDSPRGLLIGGCGSTQFAEDTKVHSSEENAKEVLCPPGEGEIDW